MIILNNNVEWNYGMLQDRAPKTYPEFKTLGKVTIPCKNLAFSGGGAPGVYAYSQAIKELRKYIDFSQIERVAGASVGSIAALIVALDYTNQEIDEFLKELKLEKVNDGGMFLTQMRRVASTLGLLKGDELAKIIRSILKRKGFSENATFEDLHTAGCKDLYVTVSKIVNEKRSPHLEKIYCSYKTHGKTSVADIIHASASATPFFPPVVFEEKGNGELVLIKDKDKMDGHFSYTDGGWSENYPIACFDQREFIATSSSVLEKKEEGKPTTYINMETIGLALVDPPLPSGPKEVVPVSTKDLANTAYALLSGRAEPELLTLWNTPELLTRTIPINRCEVSLQDFGMTDEKKEELRQCAIRAIRKFVSERAQKIRHAKTLVSELDISLKHEAAYAHFSENPDVETKKQPVDLFAKPKKALPAFDIPDAKETSEPEDVLLAFLAEELKKAVEEKQTDKALAAIAAKFGLLAKEKNEAPSPPPPSKAALALESLVASGEDDILFTPLARKKIVVHETPLGKDAKKQAEILEEAKQADAITPVLQDAKSEAPKATTESAPLTRNGFLANMYRRAQMARTEEKKPGPEMQSHVIHASHFKKPVVAKVIRPKENLPSVKLKNESEHPEAAVNVVMDRLKKLASDNLVALYELSQFCRDAHYEVEKKFVRMLQDRNLLDKNGKVNAAIKDVVLSSVDGDDLKMTLTNPVAPPVVAKPMRKSFF